MVERRGGEERRADGGENERKINGNRQSCLEMEKRGRRCQLKDKEGDMFLTT